MKHIIARESAAKHAGNWQKFESFSWLARNEVEDPEAFAHVSLGMSRDASALEQSNHRTAVRMLEATDPDGKDWSAQNQGHWAVGWIEVFVIRCLDAKTGEPTPAWLLWTEIQCSLDDYPILDEEDHSELEQEESNAVWQNCYSNRSRVAYIRQHKSQF